MCHMLLFLIAFPRLGDYEGMARIGINVTSNSFLVAPAFGQPYLIRPLKSCLAVTMREGELLMGFGGGMFF